MWNSVLKNEIEN